jgi:hypothetical protein
MFWLVFRRYAPFASFGGGFEGDGRTEASADLNATARTLGAVMFAPGTVGSSYAATSGTQYVGAGAAIARVLGKHFSQVTSSVSIATRTLDCLRFTAHSAGGNPMVPLAPAIDTFVDAHVVFGDRNMQLEGTVRGDDFPNAEVFVVDRMGGSIVLLDFKTTGGQQTGPMTRLWGAHEKQVLGTFFGKYLLDERGCLCGSSM